MEGFRLREELRDVFQKYCGSNDEGLSLDEFSKFLEEVQHEEGSRAKNIFTVFEMGANESLDFSSFCDYMMSKDLNAAFNPKKKQVHQDMSKPLTSYFCNSSHNTYLTGH